MLLRRQNIRQPSARAALVEKLCLRSTFFYTSTKWDQQHVSQSSVPFTFVLHTSPLDESFEGLTSSHAAIKIFHRLSYLLQSLKFTSSFPCHPLLRTLVKYSSVGILRCNAVLQVSLPPVGKVAFAQVALKRPGESRTECVPTSLWFHFRVQGCFVGEKSTMEDCETAYGLVNIIGSPNVIF